ncbi:methylmalonyl Co-A mutase-associated GTPase MeaB [Cellulophaga sp. Hel_I_12]|uniref:methylmalonyl Co-A mutase-associated GTPase MeaB n=1 Tax=Cellulophaga sp. Hel_I_12 TaxID=1249972 RepID=UPI0006474C53|nr:methylmalonyl Co-A mutase-associated GTPase MeaB [Cellulophaga sp. Hel_I_12]
MKKKHPISALEEKDGVKAPEIFSANSISKIKSSRKAQPSAAELIEGITKGNKTALSRAITLIESKNQTHHQKANTIIDACLQIKKNTLRIGITGVPGVGKSTFIEVFGMYLSSLGKKVAVLAVDPTSTLSKGSILGDKTRMEALVKNETAFIRPSPSGESLGGVARKTRESIVLCEAAGFDIILIETVGVGQSETAVHSMVDFFLLLKLAGAGDELQGIKRGIMEMADLIAINKADGENKQAANIAKVEFNRALHLYPPKDNGWTPQVLQCSALENTGIEEIWQTIQGYLNETKAFFNEKRKQQNKYWLLQTIDDQLKTNFYRNEKVTSELSLLTEKVMNNKISPFIAAEQLLRMHQK